MKTIIDKITQPNGSVVVVYSDGTSETIKKSSLDNVLLQAKIRGINKKVVVLCKIKNYL